MDVKVEKGNWEVGLKLLCMDDRSLSTSRLVALGSLVTIITNSLVLMPASALDTGSDKIWQTMFPDSRRRSSLISRDKNGGENASRFPWSWT
jgi:hypothetical protein